MQPHLSQRYQRDGSAATSAPARRAVLVYFGPDSERTTAMVQQSRSDSEDASASSAYRQGASNGGTMSENVSHLTDINEQKGRAASALREVASTLRERAT